MKKLKLLLSVIMMTLSMGVFAQADSTAKSTSSVNKYVIDSNGDKAGGTQLTVDKFAVSLANGQVIVNTSNGNVNTKGQINVGAVGSGTILTTDGNIINVGTTTSLNFKTSGDRVNINGLTGNILTRGIFNANEKAFVDGTNGSITATGVMNANGGLKVFNGAQITGGLNMQNSKITRVANGTEQYDAVNKGQLDQAKEEAIKAANSYTDGKIETVNGRIDATNQAVSNLDSRVTTEVGRLDKRVDATDSKVNALDTKVTTEVKRLDNKIDTEVNRLDSKIEKTDKELRRDLRNETERSMRADAALYAEMSGLGATMMAMGSMQSSAIYNPNKRGNLSLGTGVYRDSFAYAAGVSYFVNPNVRVSSTVAGGTKTKVGGGLGVSFGF